MTAGSRPPTALYPRRGELWWADLGPPLGPAPAKRRPVLVVSSDGYNASQIRTVISVTVTSNVRLAGAPGNVGVAAGTAGLDVDSVVNVSQVVTLDKGALSDRLGRFDRATLR
ncbi:MAG: type II toxin-antitoxin system PemK/MazF family toxin, partial [Acidimicrobiales bacterium]